LIFRNVEIMMPTGEHPWLSASPDNGNPLRCTIEVMFCPECLTEYRAGFTRCSDCDMELVHEIPDRKPVRKSKCDSATNFLTGSSPKFLATFISLGWIPAGLLGLMVAEHLPHNVRLPFYALMIVAIIYYRFVAGPRFRKKCMQRSER
jgi:hypothetical protein